MSQNSTQQGRVYRARDPEASPFYKLVETHFDEFERVYPERFEKRFGFWRPIMRKAIDKFVKCGDLRYGFARVRCPKCHEGFMVAFSCKQRGCCPSCDKKRSLVLGYRLRDEVLADVPHRQWVFTVPKRVRVFFRYTRGLLGKLCKAAYDTVRETMSRAIGEDDYLPAVVGAVQTFGSIGNWHPHNHFIVSEGVFTPDGKFISVPNPQVYIQRIEEIWRDKVFDLLFEENLLDLEDIGGMMMWPHSGFNVDVSVRIRADDHNGMQRLIEYISRGPFSLTRMVKVTDDDKVLYRANQAKCINYPMLGKERDLRPGMSRNYEVFEPLDFLATVTQHIPNKGEHQFRYYGYYSNKSRGMLKKKKGSAVKGCDNEPMSEFQRKRKMTWAALIKLVFEVDPLKCTKCGSAMDIVAFFEVKTQADVIKRILKHCGLWKEKAPRAPPLRILKPPEVEPPELQCDYSFFDDAALCDSY